MDNDLKITNVILVIAMAQITIRIDDELEKIIDEQRGDKPKVDRTLHRDKIRKRIV